MNQMLGPGVRTLAETRDGRITVTITVDTQESMREEIEDLDKALTLTTTSREFNRDKVLKQRAEIEELRTELATLRSRNVGLRDRLETENAERVANREWAERAETQIAKLGTTLKDRDCTIIAIRNAVYAADVRQATAATPVNPDVDVLVRAVQDIRGLLSSSPFTGTSQA